MNAQDLLNKLVDLKIEGHDLEKIAVSYRHDYDSDVVEVVDLEEGLYDEETNLRLETIVLITDNTEK
jgi:hypothetical protein